MSSSSADHLIELRGEIEREIVDVLDAIASAEQSNRMVVLRRWLRERADLEVTRATMILRVRRREGNGSHGE